MLPLELKDIKKTNKKAPESHAEVTAASTVSSKQPKTFEYIGRLSHASKDRLALVFPSKYNKELSKFEGREIKIVLT